MVENLTNKEETMKLLVGNRFTEGNVWRLESDVIPTILK